MKIRVEFDNEIPDGIPDEQILEWLRFELFANSSLKNSNPLLHKTLQADFLSVSFEVI